MRYLFIFLTLPLFLCAEQEEIDIGSIESIYDYEPEYLMIKEGHYFRPIMYIHYDKCPCLCD